jgi:hypothetical protein
MMKSSDISPYRKKHLLKDKTGHSNCLSCGRLPDFQISYDVGDEETPLKRVQHYCSACWDITLEREKKEPKDRSREKLATFYHCKIAEPGTFGGGKDEYRR